jgi:hypothetical protein
MVALSNGVSVAFFFCALFKSADGEGGVAAKSTVIVMRHCVRATDDNSIFAIPGFSESDDYASKPWLQFPVPAMFCLPRGEELVEAQGRFLRAKGGLPMPLHAVADNMRFGQRDNVTMQRLLRGLGLVLGTKGVSTFVDSKPFKPPNTAACLRDRPSLVEMKAGIDAFIVANPPSSSYSRKLDRIYEIAGKGPAGDWTSLGCNATGAWGIAIIQGACQVAFSLAERLFMEFGGGFPVARGKITGSETAELLELWTTGLNMFWGTQPQLGYLAAPIAAAVIEGLGDGKRGTDLLVGHDTNLIQLGRLLNLTWQAGPYPMNSALPGSMLRFDRDGDLVTVTYVFPADFGSLDGTMTSVPATVAETGKNTIALSVLREHLGQRTVPSCGATPREFIV